jgi:hypothetical protein
LLTLKDTSPFAYLGFVGTLAKLHMIQYENHTLLNSIWKDRREAQDPDQIGKD